MRRFLMVLSIPAALAAAELSLPDWLAPYPGVAPSMRTSAGLIESSYNAGVKPADIVAHYEKEFAAAHVESMANDDGIGISLRGSAPECDLLIKIREQSGGSFVSVNCSEKSSSAPQDATFLPQPSTARRPFPASPRERDAHTAQMLADADARHKQRIADQSRFDQPVYPKPRSEQADTGGLVLAWPPWLVHMKDADRPLHVVKKTDQSGSAYLESMYKTTRPMSEIYNFYEDVMNANGYRVAVAHLGTGSTLSHIQQNADGDVEGSFYPHGIGNGWIETRASFHRFYLNEPITVRLRVTVHYPIRLPGR